LEESIHSFKIESISGEEIDFVGFKGKKIIVVNVASECGFTPQYEQLQDLYHAFQDRLVVIGFPCNDFGSQEPGTNQEIQAFCTSRFGVGFPMTTKVSIKRNPHPIYEWLTKKSYNGISDAEVRWNFHKFLIDENGHWVAHYPSSVNPIDEVITNWVS
jgi:glutathione peroxidase